MERGGGRKPPHLVAPVSVRIHSAGVRVAESGYSLCLGETGVFKQPTVLMLCTRGIAHAALDSPLS